LVNPATRDDLGAALLRKLRGVRRARVLDRDLQGPSHGRIQPGQGGGEVGRADADTAGADAVEPFGLIEEGGNPPRPHVGDQGADGGDGGLHVHRGARHQVGQRSGRDMGQVEASQHGHHSRGGG